MKWSTRVLVAAGTNAWASGDTEQAIQFWNRSFHRNRYYQRLLIDMLSEFVPPAFFFDFTFFSSGSGSLFISQVWPMLKMFWVVQYRASAEAKL